MQPAWYAAVAAAIVLLNTNTASAQMYPPGTLRIDGFPVVCGNTVAVVTPNIPDGAMADGQGHILLNPVALGQMPTVLKLWAYAHECGHYVVGPNESAADCWAVRTGRDQGWFPPEGFQALIALFGNNPGDLSHPPGPDRVRNMMACYSS